MISILGISGDSKVEFLDEVGNVMVAMSGVAKGSETGGEWITEGGNIHVESSRIATVCGHEIKFGSDCREVRFSGKSTSVYSSSGDISVKCASGSNDKINVEFDGHTNEISSTSGDITIIGNVSGNISNDTGDIMVVGDATGNLSTTNGNIDIKRG